MIKGMLNILKNIGQGIAFPFFFVGVILFYLTLLAPIVLAIIGFNMGGFVGAVIGLIIGCIYDGIVTNATNADLYL